MRRCTRAISRSTGVSSSTAARICALKCRSIWLWKRTVRMRRETRTRTRCISQSRWRCCLGFSPRGTAISFCRNC